MKYFPYGGSINEYDLQKLSNEATANNEKKIRRKKSIKLNHLLDDANLAFQDLSYDASIYTLRKHTKILSILLIVFSFIGLFLLEINRYVF